MSVFSCLLCQPRLGHLLAVSIDGLILFQISLYASLFGDDSHLFANYELFHQLNTNHIDISMNSIEFPYFLANKSYQIRVLSFVFTQQPRHLGLSVGGVPQNVWFTRENPI